MSSVIGTVASIDGRFHIQDSQGNIREASAGDAIYVGEVLLGDKNNGSIDSVAVTLDNGNDLVLFGQEKQLFDTSLLDNEFAENETVSESESIERMFSELGDDVEGEVEDVINEEDVDAIDTESGEEKYTESTEGGEAKFAQTTGNSVDINAEVLNTDEEFRLGDFNVYKNSDADDSWVNLNKNEFEDDIKHVEFNIAIDAVTEVFTDGRIIENFINLNRPLLSGSADVNSDFVVEDEGGNIVARGTTDADGHFKIQTDEMNDGEHTFTLVTQTQNGEEVRTSTSAVIDTAIENFTADKI